MVDGLGVRIGSAAFTDGTEALREAGEAHVHIAIGGMPRGYYVMRKRARTGMADMVEGMRRFATPWLLTGDATVDPEVQRAFHSEEVRTGCTPPDKAGHVRHLQEQGHRVLMVGDGLNDAAALAISGLGVALASGTNVAIEAAAVVIPGDRVRAIPELLHLSRLTLRTIRQNLFFAFLYNVLAIPAAALGLLGSSGPLWAALAMGASDITVVGNALRLKWRLEKERRNNT